MPAMPWENPGITWSSGNDTVLPLVHDESNTLPSVKLAPTYCTVAVLVLWAMGPLPSTRSTFIRVVGGEPCPAAIVGAAFRLVAPETAGTPVTADGGPAATAAVDAGGGVVTAAEDFDELEQAATQSPAAAARATSEG